MTNLSNDTATESRLSHDLATLAARRLPDDTIDALIKKASQDHADGLITEDDLQAVYEAAAASRRLRAETAQQHAAAIATAPQRPRRPRKTTPDSLKRRRRWQMNGAVPAKIAEAFTAGENAVLAVIARQCQRTGFCGLANEAIAAIAGVCETLVNDAKRKARELRALEIRERRISYARSLPSVMRVASKLWAEWLKLKPGAIGCGNPHPTGSHRLKLWALTRPTCQEARENPLAEPS